MRIAIEVAGFTPGRVGRLPAGDGDVALDPRDGEAPPPVRRGLPAPAGHDRGDGRGALPAGRRRSPASASPRATPPPSPGPPTSRRSSSSSTRPSSSSGSINAQPMGFYPVEVLVNDAKRHGVAVLPVDVNASAYRTTTEWVGRPGWALAGAAGDDGSPRRRSGRAAAADGAGIAARPRPVRSSACVIPTRGRARALGRRRAPSAGASGSGSTS